MKQKFLLKTMLLLSALIAGSGSVWADEDDTHDFAQSISQSLNNNASISSISIGSQSYSVKEVIVTYAYNKSNDVRCSVSVNSTSWGTQAFSSTGNLTTYSTLSFSGSPEQGEIEVSFTNNSGSGSGKGTLKITNIRLVEGPSGGDKTPCVDASTITLVPGDFDIKGHRTGTFVADGTKADAGATFSYSTTATSGLTVASDGSYTASAAGSYTVKVTATPSNTETYSTVVKDFDITLSDTRASAELSWSAASADVTYGAANVFPTLTNLHSVPVTYSSTVTAAATIDGSGVITLKDVTSSTVISAIFAGNDDYQPQTVSYTLNVTEGEFVLEDGVFNFVKASHQNPLQDYGSGMTLSSSYTTVDKTWTAGNVTMVTSKVSGNGYRWWSDDGTLRFYNKSTATFTVPSGYVITKIVTTGANFNSSSPTGLSGSTWKGASNTVVLTATATKNIETITVTYTTENQSVTITDATGYATYCSPYALDFTSKEIKAYIAKAKADYSGVTFEQVNKVPANTGVLLYKSGGTTEDIPVFDGNEADDVTDNVFKPGKGATLPSVNGDLHNYILNKVGGVVGFYKANNQMVATNRAYIQIDESKVYVKEFISLPGFDDDDPTGVETIDNGQLTNDNEIYNLAGQRLQKMQKGINIVNGKKVLF